MYPDKMAEDRSPAITVIFLLNYSGVYQIRILLFDSLNIVPAPGLVQDRFQRSVETGQGKPALAGFRLDPVFLALKLFVYYKKSNKDHYCLTRSPRVHVFSINGLVGPII